MSCRFGVGGACVLVEADGVAAETIRGPVGGGARRASGPRGGDLAVTGASADSGSAGARGGLRSLPEVP